MQAPPTGTVTFLFTDIEGSTKLWQDAPDAMRSALVRHDVLLRDAIETGGGYVFKTIGDAFCAAFPTAPQALAAALAAQVALAAERWETSTPLQVRMGLHTGSADERDGDYFGTPLNRVARLMAAGHGGQLLLSAATQELTRDALPASTFLLNLGPHRLKDLGRPEIVFQLLHPPLPAEFPPLNSLGNPALPNNLPQQVTSFIGRETQVAEVKALLTKTRLLTLTGAGGSGKSRLSLQVAADLLDGEGDGVWLVELASLSDPALVLPAVAQVLGVKEQAGQTVQQALVEWLKPKRLLLILDNCEHLVAACASLAADLLRNCPQVHILASSREPLAVAGEQAYRVPLLSLPAPNQAQTAQGLSQYESVRLFIERAQAVQPSFLVTDVNAPAVAQICWRLDGIPLAIELAAARVRSLSADEINTRLDNNFRLVTGGSRNVLPRQQTLRALIDWSYDLLTEPEKTLLRRLSVFAGGWTLSAAEVVCAGETVEDFEVLDLLTTLVDKSLVVAEPLGEGTRYRLLETIRQYARERLAEVSDVEAIGRKHAAHFLALAEAAEADLTGAEQAGWLTRLEAEHDNIRAVLAWYLACPDESEHGLWLVGALDRFWVIRGHLEEGRQWLDQMLEDTGRSEPTSGRAKALNCLGNITSTQDDCPASCEAHQKSLAICRFLEDEHGVARSLNNLGNTHYRLGDYQSAVALQEESLAIRRRLGDASGIARVLGNLGSVAYARGDYPAAQALHEESLRFARQLGDQMLTANTLQNLGNVTLEQGDYAQAKALAKEGLAIRRLLGDRLGIASFLSSLGIAATKQCEYEEAIILHEESLAIRRELGDKQGIAYSLHNLGAIFTEKGDSSTAQRLHCESLMLLRQIGDQYGFVHSLEALADVAVCLKRSHTAARLLGAAEALREALGSPLGPADRPHYDTMAASICAMLGDDAFAAAWNAGRTMTLDETMEYGLSNG